MSTRIALFLGLAVLSGLASTPARAHITPPVVLASDREAVARLLPAATRYFVREVRLSSTEREAIRQRAGWNPDDDYYREQRRRFLGERDPNDRPEFPSPPPAPKPKTPDEDGLSV